MRPRKRHLKSNLPPRESAICQRLAEARRDLELDQAGAARKIGIPKSTLASYELALAPLRADTAMTICRRLLLSEEWLATGRYALAERAGKDFGLHPSPALDKIYRRQCMDLLSSPEASALAKGALFSESFDSILGRVYQERVRANFFGPGISSASWRETNIELGFDINQVLVERFLWLLQNEALRRKSSPQHAGATYLGFLMRMAVFGFKKCMEFPVTAEQLGLDKELFVDPDAVIRAFLAAESVHVNREFLPISMVSATKSRD